MKKYYTLILLFAFAAMHAQELHTPMELLYIMDKSKVTYQVKETAKSVECKDRSDIKNNNHYYRVESNQGLKTYQYTVSPAAKAWFDKAEGYFSANNFDSALYYYKKVVVAEPGMYLALTYIGQIYEMKNNRVEAEKWFKMSIEKNYIDYMAHWFLAENYTARGKMKEAVEQITIARILNRNNQNIKTAMAAIFQKAGLNPTDWCFTPQMNITPQNKGHVVVEYADAWLGYAMAKAVWRYEPGYKESMGVKEGEYSTLEDKECLVALLVSLRNAKQKYSKIPEFNALDRAVENQMLTEFALYEILLPEHPAVAYQLSKSQVEDIKDYVIKVRQG